MPIFPSAWGLMAGLPGYASHGSSLIWELAANSESSWMSGALNLHLAMWLLKDYIITITNYITKWRLGAWDVQGLLLEAGQPVPGPSSTPTTANPCNPAMGSMAGIQTSVTLTSSGKNNEGRGASRLGEAAQENLKDLQLVQPCD